MGKTNRRVIGSAVVGATTVTLAQFLPGVAAAATHQTSLASSTPRDQPSPAPDANGGPGDASTIPGLLGVPKPAIAATVSPTTGCTDTMSPDYGCGKITVEAQPIVDTFPDASLPDLGGLAFEITGTAADEDTAATGADGSCTTTSDPSDDGATCPESTYANGDIADAGYSGSWVAGDPYSVTLDPSTPPPAGTLIPAVSGTFADCTAYQSNPVPTGCPDAKLVLVYGKYHQVGLRILNAFTHKPVAHATYELCSLSAVVQPATSVRGCPSGTSVLDSETTDAHGELIFASRYLGSRNYRVVATTEPRGYTLAKIRAVTVPVVTHAAQAGTLVRTTIKLVPIRPVVKSHHLTTRENKRIRLKALSGAKPVVGPLRLIKVSRPRHGSVHRSGGKITYKPRKGYVGKDVFTYTVRNGLGATATGRIVVHVKAPKSH
jgi:hypothetical protein